MVQAYRAAPLIFACFVALCGAVITPFWLVDFLPFLDIPQHLSTIAVIHRIDDPSFSYDAYFSVELGFRLIMKPVVSKRRHILILQELLLEPRRSGSALQSLQFVFAPDRIAADCKLMAKTLVLL